jgi:hypothetical protein
MARPTKLTPEVQDAICNAIRHGATYQAASEAAGVAYDTFNEWRKDIRAKYVKFSEAVRRANADAMLDLIAKVEAAGEKDWRASAWILERRFKSDFGQAVDVTSAGEKIGANDSDTRSEILRKLDSIAAATGAESVSVKPDPDPSGSTGA